ncbi:MAG: class I SAM-dependent methyltransferase [Pyrinomonadaceae bacterium]
MKSETYIPALGYDWLTPFYDTVVRFTTREAEFKAALMEQAKIAVDHRVLDLGCGTGTLAIFLKQHNRHAEIIGIDGDAKILEIAKAKAKATVSDIQFHKGLSFDLPYADCSFDLVLSSLFFHHLTKENKLKTMSEVKRILRPTGEFHVADWGEASNFMMRVASKGIEMLDGFETTRDNFNGVLPQLISESGFEYVVETDSFDTVFGTLRLHRSQKPSSFEDK